MVKSLSTDWPDLAARVVTLAERVATSREVFVIMSFRQAHEYRDLKNAIEEACGAFDYHAKRVDETDDQRRIIPEILRGIRHSAFVIADVTEGKPNVYWELGLVSCGGERLERERELLVGPMAVVVHGRRQVGMAEGLRRASGLTARVYLERESVPAGWDSDCGARRRAREKQPFVCRVRFRSGRPQQFETATADTPARPSGARGSSRSRASAVTELVVGLRTGPDAGRAGEARCAELID